MLLRRITAVDKPGMADHDLLFDSLSEQNLLVLHAYASRSAAAKAADTDHDGWLQRLDASEQFDQDELTRIHGELIALGMLKFELRNRETGLRYRVSDRGKSTLEQQHAVDQSGAAAVAGDAAPAVAAPAQILPLAGAA